MKALFVLWLLLSSVLMITWSVPGFEYTMPQVQHILFAIFLLGLITMTWLRRKRGERESWRAVRYVLLFGPVVAIYISGSLMDFCGPKRTQTIIYQHREQVNRTIDFQMWGCGAVGGDGRRIADIRRLPLGIRYCTEADTSSVDLTQWRLVNIE
ncbi:MAG: hypothetical protein AAFP08_16135, partial [Bacteroidota bacterium]